MTEESDNQKNLPAEQASNQIFQSNIMPATLETSAQSSMMLRGIQGKLAKFITDENVLYQIAADKPEVLPGLLDAVTSAVTTSDHLLISMAKVAEKNASMNRVFEYMTRRDELKKEQAEKELQKDEWYDDSVEKIKKAIFRKLDSERDAQHRTAQDYIDNEETQDIIDIEPEVLIDDSTENTDSGESHQSDELSE